MPRSKLIQSKPIEHGLPTRRSARINKQAGILPPQTSRPVPTRARRNTATATRVKANAPKVQNGKPAPRTPKPPPPPPIVSPAQPVSSIKATGVIGPPPPVPDQADPATETETRTEVPFAKFEAQVFENSFASQSAVVALRSVSRSVALSSEWNDKLIAYRDAIYGDEIPGGPYADEEMRCLDLLNVVGRMGREHLGTSGDHVRARTPLVYVRREGTPSPTPVSRSMRHISVSPFTTPSNAEITPPRLLGVVAPGPANSELSWGNAAVVLQIRSRYDAPEEPPRPKPNSKKRPSPESSATSHSSGSTSKRRRLSGSTGAKNFVDAPIPADVPPSPQSLDYGQREPEEAPDAGLDSCAADVFHHLGNRRHVYGIHISGLQVRFYLYDRAGVVKTTPLHLEKDARTVISTLLRFEMLDAFELGVEAFFHPDFDTSPASAPVDPFSTVIGQVVKVEDRRFKITDIINSTYSRFGRGTAVYGAVLANDPKKSSSRRGKPAQPTSQPVRKSTRISAKTLSRPPPGGEKHPGNPPKSSPLIQPNEQLVLKMSWQLLSRHSEDAFLRLAESCGVEGVIRLYGSTVAGRLSQGVRGRLVQPGEYNDRELRVQVLGPRCTKLKNVNYVDDFKTAFRSLVQTHHDLYLKTGILHRDISLENLMVDARDPSRGVLVDLDIAARVRDGERRLNPSLPHAGTLGYRAIDLLKTKTHHPTIALYRHDLESFFYVLAYITSLFRDGERLPIPNEFQSWWDPDLDGNAGLKRGYLVGGSWGDGDPHPLVAEWVDPLRKMFLVAYRHRSEYNVALRNGIVSEWSQEQEESFDGMITFEGFMQLLV